LKSGDTVKGMGIDTSAIRAFFFISNFMSFINFVLEKVYDISDREESDIKKLVDKYKQTFFKDSVTKLKIIDKTPLKYFEDDLDENERYYLGSLKVKDFETDKNKKVEVFVNFDKEAPNRGEFFDEDDEIVLYYYPLGFSIDKIKDVLTHEVLHAKQHYKKMGKKYRKAIKRRKLPSGEVTFRSNRDYYFDPVEFPVYTTLIVQQYLSEYFESDKLNKKRLKSFLEDFIKSGAKPTTDSRAPESILDKYDFFKFIYRNRKQKEYSKIYKSFIKKLFWLYSKLK